MSNKKNVTMQEIADELNISKVSVSKALNGKDGVSNELKDQIIKLAKKHNYTLRSYGERKIKNVCVIMNDKFTSFSDAGMLYMTMYQQILIALRGQSCTCALLTPSKKNVINDLKILEHERIFDGVILLGILDNEVREKVESIKIPKLYVDVYDESYTYDSVVMENIYSTYELTKYLIKMGHRKIGFVGTVGATTSITDRFLGYSRALTEELIVPNNDWNIEDRTLEGEPKDIIIPKNLPTAFVSNCDETALRLVNALNNQGLRVPEDVSIASFDNDVYAEICVPKLTTVAVDVKNIAEIAAKKIVLSMNRQINKQGIVYRVPGKIIYRESVMPVN